jgi:hypothetical protein
LATQTPFINTTQNAIYIPVTGRMIAEDKIIVLDLKRFEIRYLSSELFPMVAKNDARDQNLYVIHNGFPNGLISKIDIEKNLIQVKKEIVGAPRALFVAEDRIYIASDRAEDNSQRITILDEKLNTIKAIDHNLGYMASDILKIGEKLIISNNTKGGKNADKYSDSLLELDLKSYKLNQIPIQYPPRQVFEYKDRLLITAQDFPVSSINKFLVVRKKEKMEDIKVFELKNFPYRATKVDKKIFILGNSVLEKVDAPRNVYEYEIDNFNLLKIHNLPKDEHLSISNFFVR